MSNSIKIATASFTKVLTALSLPVRTNLIAEYVFGSNAAASGRNLANPAIPALEVGAIGSATISAPGSGGTDGTFAMAFSGGGATGATGTFTVAGGVVTAVAITAAGGAYTSSPAVSLSASAGLTGAAVTANRLTPTYNANSIVVKSHIAGYGFDTQQTPSNDYTMLIIRKKSAYSGVIIAGCSAGGNMFGFAEFGSNSKFYGGGSNLGAGATYATPAGTPWMFQAGVGSYLGYVRMVHYATGVQAVVDDTNPSVDAIGRCYIGSTSLGGQPYTTEVAYYAVYNRKLTPAEIDVVYQSLKVFFALKGIAI